MAPLKYQPGEPVPVQRMDFALELELRYPHSVEHYRVRLKLPVGMWIWHCGCPPGSHSQSRPGRASDFSWCSFRSRMVLWSVPDTRALGRGSRARSPGLDRDAQEIAKALALSMATEHHCTDPSCVPPACSGRRYGLEGDIKALGLEPEVTNEPLVKAAKVMATGATSPRSRRAPLAA